MQAHTFDRLTRHAAATSRRQVLRALLGASLGIGFTTARGLAAPRTTTPPPLPPFPTLCLSVAGNLPKVNLTPNPANTVTGTCAQFNDVAAKTGVTDSQGNHPGVLGKTDADFAMAPTKESDITQISTNQWCATISLSFPGSLAITTKTPVFALAWQPANPGPNKCRPSESCDKERSRLAAAIAAHEAHHVADIQGIGKLLQQRWKTPRVYTFCGATEQAASDGLAAMVDRDIKAELTAASKQSDACEQQFHATRAGQPEHLDCAKCGEKMACAGQCCTSGLVCSSDLAHATGLALLAVPAQCVCPDGQPPCSDVCCTAGQNCEDGTCVGGIAPGGTATYKGVCLPGFVDCQTFCCPPSGGYTCGNNECCFDPSLPCLPGLPLAPIP